MNKNYWNDYYTNNLGIQEPSSFAKYVLDLIPSGSSILELGCGNGRDSFFFADHGLQVYAIDQSEVVINQIKKDINNPRFICQNILSIDERFPFKIDYGYARFVLHALNKVEADKAIQFMSKNLSTNGIFFTESRSVKSSLYGEGAALNHDVYKTDHKRRFIRKNELIKQLELTGFTIENIIEADGLAIYKDDDPVVIRINAKKKSDNL